MLDELQTLVEHAIPYELVPGITAALGAAAYAGIPLTARGYSTAVRFLTVLPAGPAGRTHTGMISPKRKILSSSICLRIPWINSSGRLLEYGIPEDRWITVIEQATTPNQQIANYPSTVYLYPPPPRQLLCTPLP